MLADYFLSGSSLLALCLLISLPAHSWLSATSASIITLLAAGTLLSLYYLAHRSPALLALHQFYTSSPLAPLIPYWLSLSQVPLSLYPSACASVSARASASAVPSAKSSATARASAPASAGDSACAIASACTSCPASSLPIPGLLSTSSLLADC